MVGVAKAGREADCDPLGESCIIAPPGEIVALASYAWVVNYGRLNDRIQKLTLIDLSILDVIGNSILKPDSSPKMVAIDPLREVIYVVHFGNPFGKPGRQISVFAPRQNMKEAVAKIDPKER